MVSGFHPRLVPTLVALPLLLVLIGLGIWQLERRTEKADLIARVENGLAQPPEPLPARIDDLQDWDFRPVTVTGRFLHDHEFHILGRPYRSAAGLHVVTPLRRSDGAGTVLINRGWVPLQRRNPASRPSSQPEGPVTVAAIARVPVQRKGWAVPENAPETNSWFWMDVPAMAGAAGLSESIQPVYLEAQADPAEPSLPIGGQTIVNFPNNHLQYALTWFGCAIVLVFIYFLSQSGRQDGSPPHENGR